jgi:hypothetical protein
MTQVFTRVLPTISTRLGFQIRYQSANRESPRPPRHLDDLPGGEYRDQSL